MSSVVFILTSAVRPGFEWVLPLGAFIVGYVTEWAGTTRMRRPIARVVHAYFVMAIAAGASGRVAKLIAWCSTTCAVACFVALLLIPS